MSIKLDETDVQILKALMEDGRRSFREIAKIVTISTPTVQSRVQRMLDSGLIKKFMPVIDVDKIEHGVTALINLKVNISKLEDAAKKLSQMDDVRSVFFTASESNLVIKIFTENLSALQAFLTKTIANIEGVSVVSSNIITGTEKEECGAWIRMGIRVRTVCDFCGREIEGKPETFKVGDRERFFCCKTCESAYKEKYGLRLEKLLR